MLRLTREMIQEAFSGIEFFEEGHKYIRNGREYLSATTFIHQFEPPFPEEALYRTAEKYGLYPEQVREAWDFLNIVSTHVGTPFHEHNEHFYNHIIDGEPREYGYETERSLRFKSELDEMFDNWKLMRVLKALGKEIPRKDRMDVLKEHFLKFHGDSKGTLVPIATEIRVYLDKVLVSGTFDQLFWSLKTKKHHIFDWKNNKAFNRINEYGTMLLPPLQYYDSCEYWIYTFQLSLYRYILQDRFPDAEFGDNFIVWFYEGNPSYELIKLPYMKEEIEAMLAVRVSDITKQ